MTKLIPLLEMRLAKSHFKDWSGQLLLDAGSQTVTLEIREGRMTLSDHLGAPNCLRGGADLARLLIGSDEPDEIIRQSKMECSGLASPLAQILFPNLHPMMSQWDEY